MFNNQFNHLYNDLIVCKDNSNYLVKFHAYKDSSRHCVTLSSSPRGFHNFIGGMSKATSPFIRLDGGFISDCLLHMPF